MFLGATWIYLTYPSHLGTWKIQPDVRIHVFRQGHSRIKGCQQRPAETNLKGRVLIHSSANLQKKHQMIDKIVLEQEWNKSRPNEKRLQQQKKKLENCEVRRHFLWEDSPTATPTTTSANPLQATGWATPTPPQQLGAPRHRPQLLAWFLLVNDGSKQVEDSIYPPWN